MSPADRHAERRARTSENIRKHALRLIFTDGYEATTVERIAAAAGGPFVYTGLPLSEAHAEFNLTAEEFAEVGAEIFCIDAGWYDDGGDWWPSVGEWQPSTTRFPGGLG